MKEKILEIIRLMKLNACVTCNHIPNEKTRQAMKNAVEGKNLIKGKKAIDTLKKLGL